MDSNKGFTIIELIVVISIISLLASIVLVNVNGYIAKAKDAAIRAEVDQLTRLMFVNFDNYGDYCNLTIGSWVPATSCDTAYSGSDVYKVRARQICNQLYNNAGTTYGEGRLYIGVGTGTGITCANSFTIIVYLNNGHFYCSGASGKGEYAQYWSTPYPVGCYYNP